MNKFNNGDIVRIIQRNRIQKPIIDLHGSTQEIEAVFGGVRKYRLKGLTFLFQEDELELISRSGLPKVITPITEIIPIRSAIISQPILTHYMKVLSGTI